MDQQFGCPAEACDGAEYDRWCHVQESPCAQDEEGAGFMSCDDTTEVEKPECSGDECFSEEFVLQIKTSRDDFAGSITGGSQGVSGLGGAHVQYKMCRDGADGKDECTWTSKATFVTSAQQGSVILHKVKLSEWPSKVRIFGRGQDAWGYDTVTLSAGGDARKVLGDSNMEGLEACASGRDLTTCAVDEHHQCTHWVSMNRDMPLLAKQTYPIDVGRCMNFPCPSYMFKKVGTEDHDCEGPNCRFKECCSMPGKCSAISCPVLLAKKDDADSVECNAAGCTVDECCEKKCVVPAYPYNADACDGKLTDAECKVTCAAGAVGTASATCSADGSHFAFSGCQTVVAKGAIPPQCQTWAEQNGGTCGASGTTPAPKAVCDTMTVGTCAIFSCGAGRGPVNCIHSKCICQPGFCRSSDGETCVAEGSAEAVASLAAASPKNESALNLEDMLFIVFGLVCGLVSSVFAFRTWERYSQSGAEDLSYSQIE